MVYHFKPKQILLGGRRKKDRHLNRIFTPYQSFQTFLLHILSGIKRKIVMAYCYCTSNLDRKLKYIFLFLLDDYKRVNVKYNYLRNNYLISSEELKVGLNISIDFVIEADVLNYQ